MTTVRDFIQSEVVDITQQAHRCSVVVSMGVGKSLIGLRDLEVFDRKGLRIMVVAPKLGIFRSWKNDANQFNLEHLLDGVDFVTYRSFTKKDLSLYSKIYFDECHNLKFNHTLALYAYHGSILGLTGTPPTDPFSDAYKAISAYCPIVYRFKTEDAVNAGILNDYRIYIHMINLEQTKTVRMHTADRSRSWLVSEREDYDKWTERIENAFGREKMELGIMRTNGMKHYASKERFAKQLLATITDKCIVFATTKVQADRLCKHSYYSSNKNSKENLRMFNEGLINEMSCVDQLSEGENIKGLRQGIIVHCFGSEFKAAQKIGRLLRLDPSETCTAHIVCYKNTVDATQVQNALKHFNANKITWLDYTQAK